jgi:hypothetical protein
MIHHGDTEARRHGANFFMNNPLSRSSVLRSKYILRVSVVKRHVRHG